MGSLAALANLHVVAEQATVVGVSAVFDDAFGTLHGVEAAEVGDTLVGDDDVDRVLRVVGMGHHRHNVGDKAAFGYRWAREDRDISVAGEVA